MKYLFEIHVKTSGTLEAMELVMDIFTSILKALGVEIVLSGVAQESEEENG